MGFVFIILFVVSIGLFIYSIYLKDPHKGLQEELDNLSMHHHQELYQIKKKLKVLEEELLVNDIELPSSVSQDTMSFNEKKLVHEIIKNQVKSLSQQGLSATQIAKQASLSVEEVQTILTEFAFKGELK